MNYTEWAEGVYKIESFGQRFMVLFLTNKLAFIKKHGQKKYKNMVDLLK